MLVDNADVISIHEETLLSSLDQVPFPSWRLIIPQLISLLTTSSRKPALQRIASHLLLKAAGSFSSVSTDASTTEDITRVLLPAMVELHQRQQSSNTIETPSTLSHPSSSLQTLVNTLKTRDPPLYEDLSEFIQSLASLALLEDERWHAVLVEAQGTLTKRLAGAYAYLKTLRPKDFSSSSITPTTSYGSVFLDAATEEVACAVAPVLAALRCHVAAAEIAAAAAAATASKGRPVTRHEKHFREKMNLVSKLHWMLEQLELPLQLVAGEAAAAGALEAALQKPLQAIKKIASEVAAVGMTVTELDLADVCPKLAAVIGAGAGGSARRSRLRVPRGLGNMITSTATSSSPFIESIEPEVKVLHTKTRPKKITLRGSDGNAYSFLVKGREDLRVDLAVSTFFAAADRALSASNTKRRSSTSSPAVMPLTVVPVGPQAGLVGWVERTKPLYGVYASYEAQQAQRAAGLAAATLAQTPSPSVAAALNTSASSKQDKKYKRGGKKPSKDGTELTKTQIKKNKKAEKEAAAAASAAAQAALDKAKQPLRPSDLFRSKLKAAGVNTSSPRSTWPLKALKSVFIDLSATAPHNMIANELLSSAAGPAHWWSRQHHYTTSTAVMSIFGYLLGVGDRHLDNVLLQSYTGTVLHVDFGVLFNRGMKLHVPEVVPFRLTHSFAAGLGVTGVEGKFKREAEAALDAVRKNVEPLRMLLQSFVEDPLISWAPEVGVKSSRLGFERCVELIHFMRSMEELFKEKETTTIDVDAAVKRVNSVLQRVSTDVGPFCSIFFKTQKALATVSEHQQQIERCSRIIEDGKVEDLALQYTLSVTATEIENLSSQLETAVHSVRLLEATHSSFGSISSKSLLASSPYAGILASIFDGQLGASLHAALPAWDPSLAAVPLGMVQSYSGARELTLVNVALGVEPSRVPVNASLLLKAATVDDAGKEAFRKVRKKP
jgi:PI-3-kinase-related kinase SMG-1